MKKKYYRGEFKISCDPENDRNWIVEKFQILVNF